MEIIGYGVCNPGDGCLVTGGRMMGEYVVLYLCLMMSKTLTEAEARGAIFM